MERLYEEYYVAFIDILGFKELLETNTECEEICTVFECLQDNAHTGMQVGEKKIAAFDEVKYYLMSDSIILYVKADLKDAFFALIGTCIKLQQKLISRDRPILLRGGVALGELYVEDKIIFGKALSAAYQLESEVSVTPRIVFNKELLQKGMENSEISYLKKMFTQVDEDDLCYAHYFTLFFMGDDLKKAPDFFIGILDLCQSYLDKTYDQSIRKKYLWLKRYALAECRLQKQLLATQARGKELFDKITCLLYEL